MDTEVKTHIEKKIVHENVQPVIVKEVSNLQEVHIKSGLKRILVFDLQSFLGSLVNFAITRGLNAQMRRNSYHNYEIVSQVCFRNPMKQHERLRKQPNMFNAFCANKKYLTSSI